MIQMNVFKYIRKTSELWKSQKLNTKFLITSKKESILKLLKFLVVNMMFNEINFSICLSLCS
jgi:hypothetical protein